MDNIQFWIYIIFAIIYFIAKNTRKKGNQEAPSQSGQRREESRQSRPQPQSFEDLLEEITGRKTLKEEPKREVENDPSVETADERYMQPKPWQEKDESIEKHNEFERVGNNRQFSDDESRKVYEESIRRAEGAVIDYNPHENYASKKVLRETAEEEEDNQLASGIKNMFQDTDSAKRAVILGEILNRKY